MNEEKKTVLLVEDEVILAMTLKVVLEKYGYNAVIAHSGEKAVEIMDSTPGIQLILMDIDLGKGMDGTEAAAIILKEHDIPVVFCSSHTEPEIVEKTEKITSYGYVVKSSSNTVLDASIKMAFKLFEAKAKERKNEEILHKKDMEFRKLLANVPDLIFQFTRKADGTYCVPIASEGIKNIFGCAPADVVDDFGPIAGVLHPDDAARVIRDIEYSAEHLTYFTCEFRVRIPGRGIQWIYSRSAPEKLSDGGITWFGFNADITERKQAENKMLESRLLMQASIESPVGIIIMAIDREYRYLFFNSTHKKAMEYAYGMQVEVGMNILECITSVEDRQKSRKNYDRALAGESHSTIEVFGDRNMTCFESFYSPVLNENKEIIGLTAYAIDITERMQAEEALRLERSKLNSVLENVQSGVFFFDEKGENCWMNPEALRIHGYSSASEMLERFSQYAQEWELCDPAGRVLPLEEWPGSRAFRGERYRNYEVRLRHLRSGRTSDVLYSCAEVRDMNGNIALLVFTILDITQRKADEERIKVVLAEKELVLREVNHRIKNNMNAMKGILLLQAGMMADKTAAAALEDASKRMDSMSILYDQLYRSAGFFELPIRTYVEPLIDAVQANFPGGGSVKVVKRIDDFQLDAKRLQPLGIIINELLTNSMKYAFTDKSDGIITFSATLTEGLVVIVVEDNGTGIPSSIDFENSSGFGLMLVHELAGQLDAGIHIERDGGTRFVLEFKR